MIPPFTDAALTGMYLSGRERGDLGPFEVVMLKLIFGVLMETRVHKSYRFV